MIKLKSFTSKQKVATIYQRINSWISVFTAKFSNALQSHQSPQNNYWYLVVPQTSIGSFLSHTKDVEHIHPEPEILILGSHTSTFGTVECILPTAQQLYK